MTAIEVVKKIMEEQGVSQKALGKRIGAKSNNVVHERLQQPNISLKTLIPMLQAMDYKILIVPSDRRVREDEYEVSGSEKKAKPDKVDLDALLGTEAPSPVSKNGKIKLPKTPKPEVEEK